MKKYNMFIVVSFLATVLLICAVCGINALATNFIESTNTVCRNQSFSSVDEAIQAMESSERDSYDTSLDFCPPYEVVYSFDYDQNTIVFYSYCNSFDGAVSSSYAVRVLKHNDDGTLSFDSGFCEFQMREPDGSENYYYFTNIETETGKQSISFLYLPLGSDKEIYVDGIEAAKIPVSIDGHGFYICYAVSNCDTFLSNHFTPISDRHKVEIR